MWPIAKVALIVFVVFVVIFLILDFFRPKND
jgi:uncharacterized membrane protein YtjA (UPF0391 family)